MVSTALSTANQGASHQRLFAYHICNMFDFVITLAYELSTWASSAASYIVVAQLYARSWPVSFV
jgi:hypothetical protein